MQIRIGEKIRELRHRDGRTQDNLATALGVTCQAISRWEANSGYPDMELIPVIANYFHITIDELFGYHGDREEKIKEIIDRAEKEIKEKVDMTECVEMLRMAAEEFPNEPKILLKLGDALELMGWQKYGARSYTIDGSDYAYEDIAYNAQNIWWQEALNVFEKLIQMDLSGEDKDEVILSMVVTYAKMGMNEKAEKLARAQNSVIFSRECLLPHTKSGEERDSYLGEAIIALMTELKQIVEVAVTTKLSLATTDSGINKLLALIRLYEAIFDDGNCGIAHIHLRDLYLHCAICKSRLQDVDTALEYFDIAFAHNQKYMSICNIGEYHYTAPLVAKVSSPSADFPTVPEDMWRGWMQVIPNNLRDKIYENPQYAECFA